MIVRAYLIHASKPVLSQCLNLATIGTTTMSTQYLQTTQNFNGSYSVFTPPSFQTKDPAKAEAI
jgi:hypothetical protein